MRYKLLALDVDGNRNAEPELKRIADYIAPPVSEDGLVEIINKFILL